MSRTESRGAGFIPVSPPTLADVAERAGVSRQTVSNAVNNPDLLRPDTLERVREAIDEMGYSPNRAARNLRTRTSQLIGLRVLPAQEGTANAMMDRFVHTLVDTVGRGRLSRAALRRRQRRPGRRLRPPPARDGCRRVRRHRHLSRQPAGGLADRAARTLRRVRSPVGPAELHAPVGRRRRLGRHPARHRAPDREGPHAHRLDRLAQGLADR